MSKLDFHVHTQISDDGTYSPAALMRMCSEQGRTHVAVTDHNAVRGIEEALRHAGTVRVLPAVELDCTFQGKNLHLLGYGIDYTAAAFGEVEQDILRQERAAARKKMRLFTEVTGITIDEEQVLAGSETGVVTGEQIAQHLLAQADADQHPLLTPYLPGGAKSDMPHVRFYWDFFAAGKPAYVPIHYLSLPDAAELVHQQGGVSVLAHPGQNLAGDDTLLPAIVAAGLDGIEAFSSYHSSALAAHYLDAAKTYGLFITCGSDFHGAHKPQIPLGGHGASWSDEDLLENLPAMLLT